MTAVNVLTSSPFATYQDHLERGDLAYQVTADGIPVFFPRVTAPGTGESDLSWRVSRGCGSVYSTTIVRRRDEPPRNVSLIELDEGFRLMSQVVDINPADVVIGMRVHLRVQDVDGQPLPLFVPDRDKEARS